MAAARSGDLQAGLTAAGHQFIGEFLHALLEHGHAIPSVVRRLS
jgi:hypothetical protein